MCHWAPRNNQVKWQQNVSKRISIAEKSVKNFEMNFVFVFLLFSSLCVQRCNSDWKLFILFFLSQLDLFTAFVYGWKLKNGAIRFHFAYSGMNKRMAWDAEGCGKKWDIVRVVHDAEYSSVHIDKLQTIFQSEAIQALPSLPFGIIPRQRQSDGAR